MDNSDYYQLLNTQPIQPAPQNDTRKVIILVVLASVAVVGLIITIISLTKFLEKQGELEENREQKELMDGSFDDADQYKDMIFGDNDSDTPLLLYNAVKNGDEVKAEWLEEFKNASKKYALEYDKTALSDGVTFGTVAIKEDIESELYPNAELRRFLIETSEGCARFDFYTDFLILHDYELTAGNCEQ